MAVFSSLRLVAERYVTWADLETMCADDVAMLWETIELVADAHARAAKRG